MGNCPSDLQCASGEKKICFRDNDEERTKYGFCLNEANLGTAKKISSGTALCESCPPPPPPPPPCPPVDTRTCIGIKFNFGEEKQLQELADKTVDFISTEMCDFVDQTLVEEAIEGYFNNHAADEIFNNLKCEDAIEKLETELQTYNDSVETYVEGDSVDTTVDHDRVETAVMPPDYQLSEKDRGMIEQKVRQYFVAVLIPFMKANKDYFCTEAGTLNKQLLKTSVMNIFKSTCSEMNRENYNGTSYTRNDLITFMFFMFVLVLIHLMLKK